MNQLNALKTLIPRKYSMAAILTFMHIYNLDKITYIIIGMMLLILPEEISLKGMKQKNAENSALLLAAILGITGMLLWGIVFEKTLNDISISKFDIKMILQGAFWFPILIFTSIYKGVREKTIEKTNELN